MKSLASVVVTLAILPFSAIAQSDFFSKNVSSFFQDSIVSPTNQFCEKLRGLPVGYQKSTGQSVAMCALGEAQIETRTLMRYLLSADEGRLDGTPIAISNYLALDRAPPQVLSGRAELFCQNIGGRVFELQGSNDSRLSLCEFQDRSAMSALSLYRGRFVNENLELTRLLDR